VARESLRLQAAAESHGAAHSVAQGKTTAFAVDEPAWIAWRTCRNLPLVEIASSTSPGCSQTRGLLEKISS